MKTHYSEADLLETDYMQPGASMPVMMHLASCTDCAARYERLERKLREAASCHTAPEKPATFWSRQRISVQRRIDKHDSLMSRAARTTRVAAAAALAVLLGGVVVYKSVEPSLQAPLAVVAPHRTPAVTTATAAKPADDVQQISHDPWQNDELQQFHSVVEWESWVSDGKKTGGNSL